MNDEKLTVSYVRLSSEEYKKLTEYSTSIYNQLWLIKSYAISMGFNIDKEYIDDGYSGIHYDRPGFESLKNDIESGLVKTVITKDLSRLGRSFIETAYYIGEYFPKHNVRFIAINDEYDSDNPDNTEKELILGIKSIINDRYVKDASIRRKQVAIAKTNEGQYIGFTAPYGYKIKKEDGKRTLEIDEYSSSIVKRIFTEVASGKTRNEVAQGLNDDKITPPIIYMGMTPSKNKNYMYDWSGGVVYRILKNKTYTGRIVKRKSKKDNYRQKKRDWVAIRDRETIENCHPAIITDELFESANSRLKIMRRSRKNEYCGLFSNLVICGTCGREMTACRVQKKGRKEQYYFQCTRVTNREKCKSRNIADSKLRIVINNTLKNIIDNYVDENEIANRAVKDLLKDERPNLKITNLQNDIELHNRNIKKLYLQKTSGEIDLQKFMEKKKNETLLKEESEKLLKEVMESKNIELRKEELLDKYNKFINNDKFINEVVRVLIEKIIVYNDNTLEISFKFGLGEPKKIQLF